jgi:hypothetical protein
VKVNTEVGVYNLALNAVGETANVSSPTENSRRAEVCRLWYDLVRDQVLEAAPWPEATKLRRLTLAQARDEDDWETGDPQPGYAYAFALPADCLRPQYLTDYAQFELMTETGVRQLHSNSVQPMLRYTFMQENVALWSNNLLMAIVYGLAAHIAQPLSGKTSLTATLVQRANDFVLAARVSSANTPMQMQEAIPDWLAGRGYAFPASQQFFYPTGSLLHVR